MKILKFDEFLNESLNEAYMDSVNKYQLLVAFVIDRFSQGLKDNFTVDTYNALMECIPRLKSKKDLKTEIVPIVAPILRLKNTELLEFIKLFKADVRTLGTQRKDKLIKDNINWAKGLSLSDPRLASSYIKGYLKRDDEGRYVNLNNPRFTGISKIEDLTFESLSPVFKNNLRLTSTETRTNTKTYSLYDFINDDTNKESSLLEDIKRMRFPEAETAHMIKVGLNNMSGISLTDYDCIVVPSSSSRILPLFVKNIVEYIKIQREATGKPEKEVKVIYNAFEKIPGKDIVWDYPAIEAIKDEKTKKNVERLIANFSKLDTGISLSKQVFVGYRKFLKEFMKLTPAGSAASGKVLIVDDFITGGSTVKEMRRLLGNSDFALTLFNVVGLDPNATEK